MSKFGEKIKAARQLAGLGLREAARKIGISPSYLSNLEQNTESCIPNDELIKKISDVVNIRFSELKQLAKGNVFKSLRRSLSQTDVDNLQAFYQTCIEKGISTSMGLSIFTKALNALDASQSQETKR